jgi:hypothetical protein
MPDPVIDGDELQALLNDMTIEELDALQAGLNGTPVDQGEQPKVQRETEVERRRRDEERQDAAKQSYGHNPLFGKF